MVIIIVWLHGIKKYLGYKPHLHFCGHLMYLVNITQPVPYSVHVVKEWDGVVLYRALHCKS